MKVIMSAEWQNILSIVDNLFKRIKRTVYSMLFYSLLMNNVTRICFLYFVEHFAFWRKLGGRFAV